MKLKLLACKVLTRELSFLTAISPNTVDVTFIRQGYHNAPDILRKNLQSEIDSVQSGLDSHTNEFRGNDTMFDAILIGYGLCSNGIVGINSGNNTLIVPRGHDCITFFLGSKEKYKHYFDTLPGCFFYTSSWLDNTNSLPSEEASAKEYAYYKEKGYDDEDIEYLIEESIAWVKNYSHAAFIRMPFYTNPVDEEYTRKAAEHFSWHYHLIHGETSLLENFINGNWDENNFLTVPPYHKIIATYDENIIGCEPDRL